MWSKIITLVETIAASVTPEEIADAKRLAEDILRHVNLTTPLPTTTAELATDMIEGDRRAQAVSDWFLSRKAKLETHAVMEEMTQAPQPSLAGALARLQQ